MNKKVYASQNNKTTTKYVLNGVALQEKTILFLLQEITGNTRPWRLTDEERQKMIPGLDIQRTTEPELVSLEEACYSGPPPIQGASHDEQFVYLHKIYGDSSARDEYRAPFLYENDYFIVYSAYGWEQRRSYVNSQRERVYPEWGPVK